MPILLSRGGMLQKRTQLLKLLPFLVSAAIYFILDLPEPSLPSTTVKCLPVLSLAFFVAAESKSVGITTPYAWRIFQGLLFSCVGDAYLVWPKFFLPGMGAFAACHICYILAFGLTPLKPFILLAIGGIVGLIYKTVLLPCLSGFYIWAVAAYASILTVLAWRSLSCPEGQLASAGSLIFILSDMLVASDAFCFSAPVSHTMTMITYYLAQALIAISVAFQKIHQEES